MFDVVDFDDDGVADNVSFIIKRIKVWTSASAPGYRSDAHRVTNKRMPLYFCP